MIVRLRSNLKRRRGMEIRVDVKLSSRIRGGRSLKRVFMRPNERALVTPFMHTALRRNVAAPHDWLRKSVVAG